jgi:predicted nucleotidyltransferase component of viral defense system
MSDNEIVIKLKERLRKNNIDAKDDYDHELKEITQEMMLAGLSKTDFFNIATFHGGTSLRIIHRIDRYSEDLDFTLDEANNEFKWMPYLEKIREFADEYECFLEIKDKSKNDNHVKKAFIKDSSIDQMMEMSWRRRSGSVEKIKIKLEIDTNPPLYSINEVKKYFFPINFDIKIQNLPSLFSGKCHALLCREYEKGRDWFDLKWFVNKGVEPNYKYLDAMLEQQGPWKGLKINSDKHWLINELINKNEQSNFDEINKDIGRFTNSKFAIILDKNKMIEIIKDFNSENYGENT